MAGAGAVRALLWFALGAENRRAGSTRQQPSRTPGEAVAVRIPYHRIMGTRTWIGATVAYFGTYWITAPMLVWLPSYLESGLGYSSAATARIVALLWAVNAVALLGQAGLTGWLTRRGVPSRWARARVGGIALLADALGSLVLVLSAKGPATVPLVIVAFGLCGTMAAVSVTSVSEIVPSASRGGALGLMSAVVTTAGLIAPVLVGRLVDMQGKHGYQDAVLLSAGVRLPGSGDQRAWAQALPDPQHDAPLRRDAGYAGLRAARRAHTEVPPRFPRPGPGVLDAGLAADREARTLDFSRPVAVLLLAVLHCIPDAGTEGGASRPVHATPGPIVSPRGRRRPRRPMTGRPPPAARLS